MLLNDTLNVDQFTFTSESTKIWFYAHNSVEYNRILIFLNYLALYRISKEADYLPK